MFLGIILTITLIPNLHLQLNSLKLLPHQLDHRMCVRSMIRILHPSVLEIVATPKPWFEVLWKLKSADLNVSLVVIESLITFIQSLHQRKNSNLRSNSNHFPLPSMKNGSELTNTRNSREVEIPAIDSFFWFQKSGNDWKNHFYLFQSVNEKLLTLQ